MRDYDIKAEDLPYVYELSWEPKYKYRNKLAQEPELPGLEPESPAIILKAHTDFIANAHPLAQDTPIVQWPREDFGFQKFQGDWRRDFFGFEDALINNGARDGFVELIIPLPEKTKEACYICKGEGWDEIRNDKCFLCDGTGEMDKYNWQKGFAITASLSIFFQLAQVYEQQTSSSLAQLMTIQMISSKKGGRPCVALGGQFSSRLCDWFRKIGTGPIPEMVSAMQTAYDYMQGLRGALSIYSFYASIDYPNGWLNVHVPGNACGLNPGHNAVKEVGGYEFFDHNLDTPFQLLTLLAGLAALHDEARQAGVGLPP